MLHVCRRLWGAVKSRCPRASRPPPSSLSVMSPPRPMAPSSLPPSLLATTTWYVGHQLAVLAVSAFDPLPVLGAMHDVFPSKHVGSEALARSKPDDSCTVADFQAGSIWPKLGMVSRDQIGSRLVLHVMICAICGITQLSLKVGKLVEGR